MNIVKINSSEISDWNSCHSVFATEFVFPDYYGRNMDAWVDCMDELVSDVAVIEIGDCRNLKERSPEIVDSLLNCAAFVNYRRMQDGQKPCIMISMLT